eukprot:PhF_6_TR13693/c0_g1_i1/m.22077
MFSGQQKRSSSKEPKLTLEQKTRNAFVLFMIAAWVLMVVDVALTFSVHEPTRSQFVRKGASLFILIMLPFGIINAYREHLSSSLSDATVCYMLHVCGISNSFNALVVAPTRPMDQYAILLLVCLGVMNAKHWKLQCISIIPALVIMSYNCSVGLNGFPMLQVEKPDEPNLLLDISIHVRIVVFLPLVLKTVHAHSQAYYQSLRSLEKTVRMAKEVSEHMAEYNTSKATSTLEKYRTSEECDADLLNIMSVIVENLTKYKPYLPNYVLLGTDKEADEGEDNNPVVVVPPKDVVQAATPVVPFEDTKDDNDIPETTTTTTNVSSLRLLATLPNQERDISYALIHFRSVNDGVFDNPQTMRKFVDHVYMHANFTNAAVHTFICDTIHMTWNTISLVRNPKKCSVKTIISLNSNKGAPSYSHRVDLNCCVMYGPATFRLTGTTYQTLLLHMEWEDTLWELSRYAQSLQTNVVCAQTASDSNHPVICVDYEPVAVYELTTFYTRCMLYDVMERVMAFTREGKFSEAVALLSEQSNIDVEKIPKSVVHLHKKLLRAAGKELKVGI